MKFVKIAAAAVLAVSALTGCCGYTSKAKCYPYPLYNYSPAKVCGAACPAPAPCAPAPCAPAPRR